MFLTVFILNYAILSHKEEVLKVKFILSDLGKKKFVPVVNLLSIS